MPGIGGIFLSSHDPQRLVRWFRGALGIEMQAQGEGGMTVLPAGDAVAILAVHAARADAPRPPGGLVESELKAEGQAFAGPATCEGIGRFAWTRTLDGHDVERWQP